MFIKSRPLLDFNNPFISKTRKVGGIGHFFWPWSGLWWEKKDLRSCASPGVAGTRKTRLVLFSTPQALLFHRTNNSARIAEFGSLCFPPFKDALYFLPAPFYKTLGSKNFFWFFFLGESFFTFGRISTLFFFNLGEIFVYACSRNLDKCALVSPIPST